MPGLGLVALCASLGTDLLPPTVGSPQGPWDLLSPLGRAPMRKGPPHPATPGWGLGC